MLTNNLNFFLMFCCPPRTGHTLIASILNSHPNVVCSNQRHILQNIEDMDMASLTSYIETRLDRSCWNPNSYIDPMPKAEIKVLGDKTGHRSTEVLISNPEKLDILKSIVKVPIKFIHVVRNPFDSLATWTKISAESNKNPISVEYNALLPTFISLNDKIAELKETEEVLTLNHESVVRNMDGTLNSLCQFLHLEKNPEWVKRVKKTLWKEPRITRRSIKWNPNMRAKAVSLTKQYSWFNGYAMGGG